jgi:trk/ktr system potassium uptake protein
MRVAFIGAGEVSVLTARALIEDGHEVVIVETDRAKIEELSDALDCGFIHGDGATPAILQEVDAAQTNILFCLTGDDRANIIAALVGRSLGFSRVVPKIDDPELEGICRELGLDDTIMPGQTLSRHLTNMTRGLGAAELSTVLKGEARFFSFTVRKKDARSVADLQLPERARAICYYRGGAFAFADADTALREGDEVVILTHSESLPALRERWQPRRPGDTG